jgi:hypothetical protein
MRTRTPTTVDHITAEKMKISERLARVDADREKIATQLAELETAERVLTRVSKAPPVRRPRSARLQKQRPRLPREAAAGRQDQPQSNRRNAAPRP